MNRRESLRLMAGVAATAGTGMLAQGTAFAQAQPAADGGPFRLPPLGYSYEALEPHIDAQTMNIHHTKHHQAFITNLNPLAEKWPDLAKSPPEAILSDLSKVPEAI